MPHALLAHIFRSVAWRSLRRLLSLRLVGRAWAAVVPPIAMRLFPRARLVVPRDFADAPAFLATIATTFATGTSAIELHVGRTGDALYPSPRAAVERVPEASVVCRLGRSAHTRVPLEHLAASLSRLLAAGNVAALSLGTGADRCTLAELAEVVRVFRAHRPCPRVRALHIAENPTLLGQERGARYLAELVSMLPNLESLAVRHSIQQHYRRTLAPAIARLPLTSLTLDGSRLDLHHRAPIEFPPTLVALSLRDCAVLPPSLPRLVAAITALGRIASCDLSGAILGAPDAACVAAIESLVRAPTLRRLDLSRNPLFADDCHRDARLARALLSSEPLETLVLTAVYAPPHVVAALSSGLPETRLSRLEISAGVHTRWIPDDDIALLRASAPRSCALVVVGAPMK
jgi:hypothetical protein